MSKNNMKLIMEGWRHSIKEMNAAAAGGVQGHAGKDEQVEEGFLKNAIIALGLMLPNLASGMKLDLGGQKVKVSQVADALKADGSEASVEAAESVLKALESDTNKDGVVDVTGGEYNMDSVDIQHIKNLLSKPAQADDGGKTMQQRVRDANQKDGGAFRNLKEGGI